MGFTLGFFSTPIICRGNNNNGTNNSHALDAEYFKRAAVLADKSAGFTSPHPNFACVIATDGGRVDGEGYLHAQGTKPAEVLAVEAAGEYCRGATAHLNMESGDCHGDFTAVSALIKVSISLSCQNTTIRLLIICQNNFFMA